MLSGKQKRYLRSLAVNTKAVVIVGKEGLSANLVEGLDKALEARELVKISILKTCDDPINEIAFDLAAATNSEIVQKLGKTIVLFRRSEKKVIEL